MLIDFDGLTIIIGIVIYILICIFIHKKYKKEKIYYVFSTIMFCYFMCIAKLTLFPIVMIGLPANIKESINIIPFHNGINRTDILNLIMTIPLGIGIPFITKINNIKKILLLGLCFGLGIETIQYLETFLTKGFSHRIIDINDVIFNELCLGNGDSPGCRSPHVVTGVVAILHIDAVEQQIVSLVGGDEVEANPTSGHFAHRKA